MNLAYRILIRLYPRDHQKYFGVEMQDVFEESAREYRARGWAVYTLCLLAECGGLVIGLGSAWAVKFTGRGYVHDQRLIRPSTVGTLPGEVQEAQDRLTINLNGLLRAISHRQFLKARIYAALEQKAREDLRLLREKYDIAEGDLT